MEKLPLRVLSACFASSGMAVRIDPECMPDVFFAYASGFLCVRVRKPQQLIPSVLAVGTGLEENPTLDNLRTNIHSAIWFTDVGSASAVS